MATPHYEFTLIKIYILDKHFPVLPHWIKEDDFFQEIYEQIINTIDEEDTENVDLSFTLLPLVSQKYIDDVCYNGCPSFIGSVYTKEWLKTYCVLE